MQSKGSLTLGDSLSFFEALLMDEINHSRREARRALRGGRYSDDDVDYIEVERDVDEVVETIEEPLLG